MSYAEKLAENCIMAFLLSGASEKQCVQAHIEEAMQAQREACTVAYGISSNGHIEGTSIHNQKIYSAILSAQVI